MILDPESSGDSVLKFVGELLLKLDQLQSKAFTYKNYQKNFKVICVIANHVIFGM